MKIYFFSLMPLIQLSKTEGLLWYQKKQFKFDSAKILSDHGAYKEGRH
jgi:hypothetical protein